MNLPTALLNTFKKQFTSATAGGGIAPICPLPTTAMKPRRKLISVSKKNGVLLFNCHKTPGKKTLFHFTGAVNSIATKRLWCKSCSLCARSPVIKARHVKTGQIVDEREPPSIRSLCPRLALTGRPRTPPGPPEPQLYHSLLWQPK